MVADRGTKPRAVQAQGAYMRFFFFFFPFTPWQLGARDKVKRRAAAAKVRRLRFTYVYMARMM